MSNSPKSTTPAVRFSKPLSSISLIETLETRSMMAAHVPQQSSSHVGVDADLAVHAVLSRAKAQESGPAVTLRATDPDRVRVIWTRVEGATGYRVERAESDTGAWDTVATTGRTRLNNFLRHGNRLYRFRVTAVMGDASERVGEAVSIRPTAALAHANARAGKIAGMVESFRAAQMDLVASNLDKADDADFQYEIRKDQKHFAATMKGMGVDYEPMTVGELMPPGALSSTPRLQSTPPSVTMTVRSSSELAVNWTSVTGGLAYKVEKSTDGGTNWSVLTFSTGNRFVDVGLTADTAYQYRLSVITSSDTSPPSAAQTATTSPVSPGDLAVSATNTTTVALTWTAVANATGYTIERSTNNTNWTPLTPSPALTGTSAAYSDATASAGTTYYYRITTVNGGRTSAASASVAATTKVAAPTLTATVVSDTRVNLAWTALATAFEYTIERSDDAGTTWNPIATTSSAKFVDAGLTANTDYRYRVSGTNAGGTGAASAVQSVTTLLGVVTGFTATPSASADSIDLAWSAVTDADSYSIERSTNQSTWTALVPSPALTGTDTSYTDATVSAGTKYYYRIVATNSDGNGAAGDNASALVRPATPSGLTVTATSQTAVAIAWTGVTSAATYTVQKSADGGTTWANLGAAVAGTGVNDTGLAADTLYQYRVKATNASGSSDNTAAASLTTAPAMPTALAGTFDAANDKIALTWGASADADTYVIERSTDGTTWTTLSPSPALAGTDTSYADVTGIMPGTSFRYRISATNANGTSVASSTVTVLTIPAVPTLTATPASATSVALTWPASATATGYTLQMSDDAGSTWNTVYTGATAAYTKTGLTADTDYQFQVLATNATGDSDYSAAASVTTILAAPTNTATTTPGATSVTLTWDATTHATGYKIERAPTGVGATWTTLVPSPALTGTDVTYTDTGLTANTAYQYRVSAINGNGTSAAAAAVSVTTRVGVTAALTATASSTTAMAVSWTAVPGATSYKLEGSPDGTTWSDLATQSTLTYSQTGLTANTAYKYRVTASNTAGVGVASGVTTASTLAAAPTGFTAASPSATSVTLTWAATTGATGYKIEKSLNGSTWTVLAPSPALTGTDTTYTDTGLTAATSYQYRVSAVTAAGTGAATAASAVVTRPLAPTLAGTVVSGTQINLTWAAVTGATSYTVQKSADNGTTWTSAGSPTGTTLSVTGLAANTTYLFRATASNASGASVPSSNLSLKTLLASPTGLAATTTVNGVALTWTAVTGATGYKLERAIGTGAFTVITPSPAFTGTTAAYTDSNLTAGTAYKYRLSAMNAVGTSAPTAELTATTKPVAPTLTTSTTGTTAISLSWSAVTSATSYKVEASADAGTTWSTLGTPSTTTYNATGLTADSAYSFRVSATNAGGTGAASTAVATRTLLTTPTGFELLDADSTTATLAWTGSDNATSYVIERSANNGTAWTTLAPVPALTGTDTSYTDTGLTGGTTYLYRLSGSNAAGKSAATGNLSVTTLAAAPTVTVGAVTGTTVNLSWTASPTATSYRVERSGNAGATWTTIASPTTNGFSDTGVQAARNYSYRVSAVNAAGVGDASAEVAVATLLSAPTGLTATALSATSVGLSWTAPAGATGYKIERSTDTNTWSTLTQSPVLAGTATYFTNTLLTAGTDYYYRITALGSGTIVSPTTNTVRATTVLAAPTGLAAVAYSTTQINLTWTNTVNYSRTGYKLQRSPNGTNSWSTIATPAATATSYSNTGLTSGTRYFYRLVAVSVAGDSAAGTVVNATTK